MAYISNSKGENFVVPSYRDLVSDRFWEIKRNILSLSVTYGEYVNLQKVGISQFSVVFSHEPGYLFGESVWSFLKKPSHLIYCELNPNQEIYLVIIKNGNVYLDGVYSAEDLMQELLVFTTQEEAFEFYIYGDVPIAQEESPGKIFFRPPLIKSFNILQTSLVNDLPIDSVYQLQLVDNLLSQQDVYLYPVKYIVAVAVILITVLIVYVYQNYSSSSDDDKDAQATQAEVVADQPATPVKNLLDEYSNLLASPHPAEIVFAIMMKLNEMLMMNGIKLLDLEYKNNMISFNVGFSNYRSATSALAAYPAVINITNKTAVVNVSLDLPLRGKPSNIYPLQQVVGFIMDTNSLIFPDLRTTISVVNDHLTYKDVNITLDFSDMVISRIFLFLQQIQYMPLILTDMKIVIKDDMLSGTIVLQALGN